MILSFVAAMDRNRVIGTNNALPWNMPADMKHFRDLTRGKPVIMGRRTFESIGHALPKRPNIVITREADFKAEGCAVVHSIDEAIRAAGNAPEAMVIGGGVIFKEFLPRANRMYLTLIDHDFDGDIYFPEYDAREWHEVSRESHEPDDKNPYPYTFITLERRT